MSDDAFAVKEGSQNSPDDQFREQFDQIQLPKNLHSASGSSFQSAPSVSTTSGTAMARSLHTSTLGPQFLSTSTRENLRKALAELAAYDPSPSLNPLAAVGHPHLDHIMRQANHISSPIYPAEYQYSIAYHSNPIAYNWYLESQRFHKWCRATGVPEYKRSLLCVRPPLNARRTDCLWQRRQIIHALLRLLQILDDACTAVDDTTLATGEVEDFKARLKRSRYLY